LTIFVSELSAPLCAQAIAGVITSKQNATNFFVLRLPKTLVSAA
jgi:hypothetical protein